VSIRWIDERGTLGTLRTLANGRALIVAITANQKPKRFSAPAKSRQNISNAGIPKGNESGLGQHGDPNGEEAKGGARIAMPISYGVAERARRATKNRRNRVAVVHQEILSHLASQWFLGDVANVGECVPLGGRLALQHSGLCCVLIVVEGHRVLLGERATERNECE
jgi:hypothetical protein